MFFSSSVVDICWLQKNKNNNLYTIGPVIGVYLLSFFRCSLRYSGSSDDQHIWCGIGLFTPDALPDTKGGSWGANRASVSCPKTLRHAVCRGQRLNHRPFDQWTTSLPPEPQLPQSLESTIHYKFSYKGRYSNNSWGRGQHKQQKAHCR